MPVDRTVNQSKTINQENLRRVYRQKKLGADSSKKWYGPITFVKKYWSFRRAIGAYGPASTYYGLASHPVRERGRGREGECLYSKSINVTKIGARERGS